MLQKLKRKRTHTHTHTHKGISGLFRDKSKFKMWST